MSSRPLCSPRTSSTNWVTRILLVVADPDRPDAFVVLALSSFQLLAALSSQRPRAPPKRRSSLPSKRRQVLLVRPHGSKVRRLTVGALADLLAVVEHHHAEAHGGLRVGQPELLQLVVALDVVKAHFDARHGIDLCRRAPAAAMLGCRGNRAATTPAAARQQAGRHARSATSAYRLPFAPETARAAGPGRATRGGLAAERAARRRRQAVEGGTGATGSRRARAVGRPAPRRGRRPSA